MHLGDLEQDLQRKLEEDRKKIEALHSQELEKLKQNLQDECWSVLSTIRADTQLLKQKINTQLKWFLVLPGAILISLLVGSSLGSWVMSRSLANQAEQIQAQKKVIEMLKNKTWGVELYQTEKGRFIILPPDSQYKTHWKCNGKPCLKL